MISDKCRGIANRDFSHGTSWAEPLDIRETIFKQMAYSHGRVDRTVTWCITCHFLKLNKSFI